MRITRVSIPDMGDGLDHITMERLGPIVLITGKNGSGKTRLLNRIKQWAKKIPGISDEARLAEQNKGLKMSMQSQPQHIYVKSWENSLKENTEKLNYRSYLEFSEKAENYPIVEFVPKGLELQDCNDLTPNQLERSSQNVGTIGISNLQQGTFARIQYIQNKWWDVQHPLNPNNANDKEEVISSYNQLNDSIKKFLGTELTRVDGKAQLFGIPLGKTNLSDGQKILLQLCIAIYAQSVSLNNLILIMDEPENHLHPSALIEVIDKITQYITNGQLWIVTHSLSLLSHLDTSYIWYMENNQIYYSGRQPEKVLMGLLGNEEQISRLSDFLSLPAQFASNQFAYECLFQPQAVQTDVRDAQTTQITNEIKKYTLGEKIRILDYGAGKGRLADAVFYSEDICDKVNLPNWFDYIAFDTYSIDKEICQTAISRIYNNADKRYFNDESRLQGEYNEKSFDVIVMCNVLHEIPSKDWLTILGKNSTIFKLLKDEGILLLVEDQLIPVGEKPHQNGFVVLSLLQVKKLFAINENEQYFSYSDARKDNRLMAYQIPKQCLERITSESRKLALESTIGQAKIEIKKLREQEANYKNGKLHGFWIQQLANAQLCLDEL